MEEKLQRSALGESRPAFLTLLDSDPDAAFSRFYEFTWRLLVSHPPRVMRGLSKEDREDLISTIITHCWDRDQRVLRMYRDEGKAFEGWFLAVVYFQVVSWLRSRKATQPLDSEDESRVNPLEIRDSESSPLLSALHQSNQLDVVLRCIGRATETCQLLLWGSAHELRPRELVLLLGWPKGKNQKAADALYQCRRNLLKLLRTEGLDPNDLY